MAVRLLVKVLIAFWCCVALLLFTLIVLVSMEVGRCHRNYLVAVRDRIPAKIITNKILADDYEEALPGGWCHGLTFRMDQETVRQIETQGLSFFKTFRPSSPDTASAREDQQSKWTEWREGYSPDVDKAFPRGCLKEFDDLAKRKGYAVNQNTKIYYSYQIHRGYSGLWVFPDWGIVVYSNWAN